MKALAELDNVAKGYLLAKLFPGQLETLVGFIKQETERFRKHQQYVESIWGNPLFSKNFWFGLVDQSERIVERQGRNLFKSARIFSDHLFDGYNAVFTIHCLIEYAYNPACDHKLKQGIFLLFGEEKLIDIVLEES